MAGTRGGFAGAAQPEKKVDVPFLAWAKTAYDQRNATVTKDDPEGFCLPSGIPRMYATSFFSDLSTTQPYSVCVRGRRICGAWSTRTGGSKTRGSVESDIFGRRDRYAGKARTFRWSMQQRDSTTEPGSTR
jgi:hypothetical protein